MVSDDREDQPTDSFHALRGADPIVDSSKIGRQVPSGSMLKTKRSLPDDAASRKDYVEDSGPDDSDFCVPGRRTIQRAL